MSSLVFICITSLLIASPGKLSDNIKAYEGKIVSLDEVKKKSTSTADAKAEGVALKLADGTFHLIAIDDVSRLLFLDAQFLGREVRLTAQLVPGGKTLKVKKVQTIVDGKRFNVDYWCERCQLAATEPGRCRCCGDVVMLRELPVE